jgi:hypothetical protein
MTSHSDAQTAPATPITDCAEDALSVDTTCDNKHQSTGFASLINAAKAAAGKPGDQPRHSKLNLNAHTQKIGPAPNGSRRSMGKR